MRAEGLEPPSLAAPAPKAGVSANFTTPAASLHPTSRLRGRGSKMVARPPPRGPGGTGVTANIGVSKTLARGSIPRSPALVPGAAQPRRPSLRRPRRRDWRGMTLGASRNLERTHCRPLLQEGARSGSALRRLDEHQLPPVQHLGDRTGLLDLRVRVPHRVMQGLDVDAGNLHAAVVPPTVLSQTTTCASL